MLYAINPYKFDLRVIQLYTFNTHTIVEETLPRVAVDDNSRMSLRVRPEDKALILRAAALHDTDLTDFVIRQAVLAAKAVVEEADHIRLSGRDSLRVLNFLEHPPAPNKKLLGAARALSKRSAR